jgi:polyisoprenyl-phosphate glycosyltransferase
MKKKLISIVTPCYNEAENINELSDRIKKAMNKSGYIYEHIYIDNCSTDDTINQIKKIAAHDKKTKLIINTRNFGHIRSPYYAMLEASGDAVILMSADLQDPPETLIPKFLKKWTDGFLVVLAVKALSDEPFLMRKIRRMYYYFINLISEVELVKNTTGSGIYDKKVIKILRKISDPYPYLRGLVSEIGYPIGTVNFHQPCRAKGNTKNNLYSLYDLAILGITNHSKIPIRAISFLGFILSLIAFFIGGFVLFFKIFNWNSFEVGTAPIIISSTFFIGMQMLFIGVIGEYVLSMHTRSRNFPLVIERERVNFEKS